jgi:hypothetical protein
MNTNSGDPWSKAGTRDLTMELVIGRTIAEIASRTRASAAMLQHPELLLYTFDHI